MQCSDLLVFWMVFVDKVSQTIIFELINKKIGFFFKVFARNLKTLFKRYLFFNVAIVCVSILLIYTTKLTSSEYKNYEINHICNLKFLKTIGHLIFSLVGLNSLTIYINRMFYSLPIDLLSFDADYQDLYSTKNVPAAFNLYDTHELKGNKTFERLDFWHEYHSLKCIAVNSTNLCKNFVFPNLKEQENISCLELLMDYSCKSITNINKILMTSKILSSEKQDHSQKESKINGNQKQSSFMDLIKEDQKTSQEQQKDKNEEKEKNKGLEFFYYLRYFRNIVFYNTKEREIWLQNYHLLQTLKINIGIVMTFIYQIKAYKNAKNENSRDLYVITKQRDFMLALEQFKDS